MPSPPFDKSQDRADSRLVPSQWETVLFCNDVSYWLGANLESAMQEPIETRRIILPRREHTARHPDEKVKPPYIKSKKPSVKPKCRRSTKWLHIDMQIGKTSHPLITIKILYRIHTLRPDEKLRTRCVKFKYCKTLCRSSTKWPHINN